MSETKKGKEGAETEVDSTLHELLLKQQALLLQQSDYISKVHLRKKEENDEIDLSVLIPRFLKKKRGSAGKTSDDGEDNVVLIFIQEQFNLIFRNRFLLAVFGGLGMLFSIYTYYASPKAYQSTMTVASGFFDNTYYASLLYPLESLSQSGSYKGLAKTLKLDTIITKKLKYLKYRDYLSKDEAENKNDSTLEVINRPYFKINVVVSDNSVLEELQKGIFNYLSENSYVNKRIEIRKLTLSRSVKEMKKEASWLDTLKTAIVSSLNSGKAADGSLSYTVNGNEVILSREDKIKIEAVELFTKSRELGNRIVNTEAELMRLRNNLQTVGGFTANSAYQSFSLRTIGLGGIYALIWGLVLVYSIALFRYLVPLKRS